MAAGDPDPELVSLGITLLARLRYDSLLLREVMDRIEYVSSAPTVQRAILEDAQRKGVIEREGTTITIVSDDSVDVDADVVAKDGQFDCRRCGDDLSSGYFLTVEDIAIGPFDSDCIQRVTGQS